MDRKNKIINALRLGHLNKEEKKYIEKLIEKSSDCFHLAGERLDNTNVI